MKISTHLFGLVFSVRYLEVGNLTQRALFLVWLDRLLSPQLNVNVICSSLCYKILT